MAYQRDSQSAIRWFACVNAGGSQLAAAAPCQVVGVTLVGGEAVYQVAEIGAGSYTTFNPCIAFMGPQAVAAGANGTCTLDNPVQALWDTGTPNAGDAWGIKFGQSSLTKNGVGRFLVDGIVDSGAKRMLGRWLGIDRLLAKYTGSGSSPLARGTSGQFTLWSGAAGSEAATSWTLNAVPRFEAVDKSGFAELELIDGVWYAVRGEHYARWLSGTISSLTSSLGATATMTVASAHDGVSPGSSVTVTDADGLWGTISTSTKCKAYYNPDDGKYYLLWVSC